MPPLDIGTLDGVIGASPREVGLQSSAVGTQPRLVGPLHLDTGTPQRVVGLLIREHDLLLLDTYALHRVLDA